ncbi:MAG: DUF4105 domain-containing protein, partial [Saprospiraceae bacterium]
MNVLYQNKFLAPFLLLFLLTSLSYSQDSLQISLLSCSPGEELYSTFGHSAFRVRDFKGKRDIVFNYGTFNFREKNFYLKFMQGKLKYLLSVESYEDFIYSYALENRIVYEQEFNLSQEQKSQLIRDLQINAQPANRAYKYDFFWDNCSTRIRDKIDHVFNQSINYPVRPGIPFRDYLHRYLVHSPWSRFGIDLILGMPTDAIAQTREAMFLPLEMMYVYDSATIHEMPTNSRSHIIQASIEQPLHKTRMTPFLVCLLLFAIVVFCRFALNKSLAGNIIFNMVMIITGIGGLIIFFLWFISEHTTTDNNLHLIWANPLLLLYPFRKKIWSPAILIWLSRVYVLMLSLLILFFKVLPQAMPSECIFLWMTLILIVIPEAQIRLGKKS